VLANPAVALTPEGVYRYTLAATGDEAEAQKARTQAHLRERLNAFRYGAGEGI